MKGNATKKWKNIGHVFAKDHVFHKIFTAILDVSDNGCRKITAMREIFGVFCTLGGCLPAVECAVKSMLALTLSILASMLPFGPS